jgi:uncharacterized protein (TIGR03067 family)
MRSALVLVLAAALPVVAQEAKDDAMKKALKELEGTWVVESAVDSKEGIGSEFGLEYVFAGDKMTRQNPADGETLEFAYKIDPSVSPKAFDWIWPKGKFVCKSIYEIKGDTLRICMSKARPDERPTEFTDDTGYCLVVLKRPKP